jgi:hypothetical protein
VPGLIFAVSRSSPLPVVDGLLAPVAPTMVLVLAVPV